MISPARLQELISYDPETGALTWRIRPGNRKFNARFAGKPALNCLMAIGYRHGEAEGSRLLAHRVAFAIAYERWPLVIDHINGDRADNRLSNLRECSFAENARNMRRISKHGFKGVKRSHSRWRAVIWVDYQEKHLGCFSTAQDAAQAYDTAARHFFGDFTALNFPATGEQSVLSHSDGFHFGRKSDDLDSEG